MSEIDEWDCSMSQVSYIIHSLGMVCIVGVTGRIIVIKIDPGGLLLVNAVLSKIMALEKLCLLCARFLDDPMMVLDLLLHFPIQGDSRCKVISMCTEGK